MHSIWIIGLIIITIVSGLFIWLSQRDKKQSQKKISNEIDFLITPEGIFNYEINDDGIIIELPERYKIDDEAIIIELPDEARSSLKLAGFTALVLKKKG
jgi:hypothetical protein